MVRKVAILLVMLVICVASSCWKNCETNLYDFQVPATLSPALDTFNVGDTITIQSSFSEMVYDKITQREYHLKNFNFFPGTEIKLIDTVPAIEGALFFDLIVDSIMNYELRYYSGNQTRLKGKYIKREERYILEFSIVPKEIGLFYLEQGIAPSINPNQSFEGKCTKPGVYLDGSVRLNNGADNNIEMLKESPDPHYSEWILIKPEERFYKFAGYCFYVKE